MTTAQSSTAINAELQALLNAMSSTAEVIIRDASGNQLAVVPLPNPPGIVFNGQIVLLGMPQSVAVSSGAPVGAIPASADIINASGVTAIPLVTGLPIVAQPNSIALASSAVNPGGQIGILGGAIVIP